VKSGIILAISKVEGFRLRLANAISGSIQQNEFDYAEEGLPVLTKRYGLIVMLIVMLTCFSDRSVGQANGGTIRIGALWPLSGGAATIGTEVKDGMDFAIAEINSSGGIKSMRGAKLEPVYADTQSRPDIGVAQADRLLGKEKVVMLLGAYNSAVTFPVTDVAERYDIPMLVNGAAKDEITERKYKNVFRILSTASYDVKLMTNSLEEFAKQKKFQVQTVGIVYDSSDWGADTAKIIRGYAQKAGWKDVLNEPIRTGQADMSPVILKVKSANPDVLFVALYTPEHILFNKAYAANKVYNKFGLWSVGAGAGDPAFYKAVPDPMIEYMFVMDAWDTGGPARDEWKAKLAKACKQKYGYDMSTFWALGYITPYVAKEALERAGSTDPAAIRKAFTEINITSGPAMLVGYQRIKFDENGQNTYAHGTISQRQGGKRVVLWPPDNKTPGANFVLPIPEWNAR
jgi:branched-chain amino acid transport system substrate-binding protein